MQKLLVLTIVLITLTFTSVSEAQDNAVDRELFDQQVLPILQTHCFECHGGGEQIRGEFVMTDRDGLLKGGETGPAFDRDQPLHSLIWQAVNYDSLEMPPKEKLPEADLQVLKMWLEKGAPFFGDFGNKGAKKATKSPEVNDETKKFWSFVPVQSISPPTVKNEAWIANEVDRFILSKLESKNLVPNQPARREALLRRAYYDLTGLPPSPDEVTDFLNDSSPEAFEKVIDRLLDSPQYGEKWGRHWLDLVRYAETNSYERDGEKPHIWRYRDYVIDSFNRDKPFPEFIREQLAGDEFENATPEQFIATGYYRLGKWDDEPADPEQALYDDLDDILATTSQVFLGLTINCARCHEHKIDPIPQEDYYRMLGFFRNVRRFGVRSAESVAEASIRSIASPENLKLHEEKIAAHRAKIDELTKWLEQIEERVKPDFESVEHEEFKHEANRVMLVKRRVPKLLTDAEFEEYRDKFKERNQLRRSRPSGLDSALVVKENGSQAPDTYFLSRGNPHAPTKKVEPGFISVLSPPEPVIHSASSGESSGRRTALAQWIGSAENPLTARVLANRIWQYHFGRGIVRTASDFGFQGSPPTHPELLDWLAKRLVDGGWKLKPMHKLIMLSNAYQMSSENVAEKVTLDPTNDLFWRFDPRRLTAEELRDSILAVNGSLNLEMSGPGIYTDIPQEVLAGQSQPGNGWGKSPREQQCRRSIYIHVKRSLIDPFVEVFDAADTDTSCPVRFVTTQPTQALALINSSFVNKEAEVFANLLRAKSKGDTREKVTLALSLVMQRKPSELEIENGFKFIQKLQTEHNLSEEKALQQFCLLALNLNEFAFLD